MAVERKYRGVEQRDEVKPGQARADTRGPWTRAKAFFATTDGVIAAMLVMPILALFSIRIPFSGELLVFLTWIFYQTWVNPGHNNPKRTDRAGNVTGKHRVYDFPYRVPLSAKRFDGSYSIPRLGNGITFLGREISSKLEIWSSDSDLRTHMLVLGTTGSGKTEFLLGLVYNALIQNSGFLYTDGKGAVDLYNNVFRLARYLGREDDLLVISFLTSGRDFLDKQVDRTTNTMNPFALGSSGMLIELIISLMDDSGGGGDMWKGRAIAFVAGLTRVLCYLRDRGYILLDATKFIEFFELPVVERVVFEKKVTINDKDIIIDDPLFEKVIAPLKSFVLTLPGYSRDKLGQQEQKTMEQHGFITMQLTRLFGDLSFTYGYIFQTLLGEVDMYDVVINRRILVVLLPSLERAPDSLKMLGKLIVGSIKQMMAGCLGNRLEGSVREIVDARPTNAAVPFYVVLDEYGDYAVLGFAVAPAQARSLGFPQPLRSKIRTGPDTWTTMGEIMPGDTVMLPDGRYTAVKEVRLTGPMPVARIRMASGKDVDAAFSHHWPVRIREQHFVKTTREIDALLREGVPVEFAVVTAGGLEYDVVDRIEFIGIESTRCIVVEDELHCYVTDGDIVTHNCITFAAQDFSSLQKASKEEADATWENTNVRIVGRITSGTKSETWERISGVASEAPVWESGRKEHDASGLVDGYRTNRDANVREVKRVTYDDLAQQENGEFTFLIGKKQSDGTGGVRVVRARTFYTAVKEIPTRIRINHFLKVEPPRTGGGGDGDQDMETIETLEKLVADALKKGDLAKVFPAGAEEAQSAKVSHLYKVGTWIREAREAALLPLDQAIRVALLCDVNEAEVTASEAARVAKLANEETDAVLARTAARLTSGVALEPGAGLTPAGSDSGAPVSQAVPQSTQSATVTLSGDDVAVLEDDDLPMSVPAFPDEPDLPGDPAVPADPLDPTEDRAGDDSSSVAADTLTTEARVEDEFAVDFSFDEPLAETAVPAMPVAEAKRGSSGAGDDGAGQGEGNGDAAAGEAKGSTGGAAGGSSGGTSGGASGASAGAGGGGPGMGLVPMKSMPAAPAATVRPTPSAQPAQPTPQPGVMDARTAVIDYLDSYEFTTPPLGEGSGADETAAAGDGSAQPRQVVSVLTLRTLGEDEEPNEISSYLAEQIAMTDAALGIKKDSLEIQADAKRTADGIEKMTSYVDGPTPAAPTIQEWDETVEGLVEVADRNPPNYL
jgi:hypothetical protein